MGLRKKEEFFEGDFILATARKNVNRGKNTKREEKVEIENEPVRVNPILKSVWFLKYSPCYSAADSKIW